MTSKTVHGKYVSKKFPQNILGGKRRISFENMVRILSPTILLRELNNLEEV